MTTSAGTEQTRLATERLLAEHPQHIPVVVECPGQPEATMRFLVPRESTVGSILRNIRSKQEISSTESLFLFVDNTMLPVHQAVEEIYARHHSKVDLRLYMRYARENTFGAFCSK